MKGNGRRPGIGLACAGGVFEGAFYEIGVLCALEEAVEGLDLNRLDAYVGVSAGALIVSCLANGIPAETMSRAVTSRADPLLDLHPEILFTPALREFGSRAMRIPGLTARAVRKYLRGRADISLFGAFAELLEALPMGLFDGAPLEHYLARIFSMDGRTDDFRDLPAPLRVVAVNLDTSELVAFGGPETAHVPISRAVRASTALPGLYCPVEIDGEHYIDGVARRTMNASQALSEGVDLVFCINPIVPVNLRAAAAEGRVPHDTLVKHGLPAVLSQTFRTVIHSRMLTGFRNYEHTFPDADLVLIEPRLEDPRLFFSNIFSFANRHDACEMGYRSARHHLVDHEERLAGVLERHGLRLRTEVLHDPSRTLFGEGERTGNVYRDSRGALDRLDRALDLAAAIRRG